MIKIGVIDDIRKLGEELKSKIELNPSFKVEFIKPNGKELLKELEKNQAIDLLFMDIEMPIMDGIATTKEVVRCYPNIKVIICSIYEDDHAIKNAIEAGAVGYLLKEESPQMIHLAIEEVIRGGAGLNAKIAMKTIGLLTRKNDCDSVVEEFGLTPREMEVLNNLGRGMSYDQIASEMYVSSGTVRKHVENLYRKLGVNNKIDAIQKLKF
jgi:DNA-binding NarL/FixJ family response regulator